LYQIADQKFAKQRAKAAKEQRRGAPPVSKGILKVRGSAKSSVIGFSTHSEQGGESLAEEKKDAGDYLLMGRA
jgi:hypothetical protein